MDLPEPERPVNQMIVPLCRFCCSRRERVTVAWCQTTLELMIFESDMRSFFLWVVGEGRTTRNYCAHASTTRMDRANSCDLF